MVQWRGLLELRRRWRQLSMGSCGDGVGRHGPTCCDCQAVRAARVVAASEDVATARR